MNVAIFGSGYVGLVTGACLANMGNVVTCVDISEERIASLNRGECPIFEPGLSEMLRLNVQHNRLFFTLDAKQAIEQADIIFITVGTPSGNDGSCDLRYVFSVADTIGKHMNRYKVIVDKSTVPVGTADKVRERIQAAQQQEYPFAVVSNPEFLREGEAIKDFMNPDRVVLGVDDMQARDTMVQLYKGIERTGKPIYVTSIRSAELIKYAANAFLATKISFMNELSHLCEQVDADVKQVARGIGLDSRIGPRFLQAGIGYGGSCFPKDVQALIHTAKEHDVTLSILDSVHRANDMQKRSLFTKIKKYLGDDLGDKRIGILGLSFKPKTDDIREAPSLVLIEALLAAGAQVQAFDPVSMKHMQALFPASEQMQYCNDPYAVAAAADCLVLVTEWDEFRHLDFSTLKETMRHALLVDGRNMYDPQDIVARGFHYVGVGRVPLSPTPTEAKQQ